MTPIKDFQARFGNLEIRTCDIHLCSIKPHTTAEIAQWSTDGKYRWTIARWIRESEGYSLRFVSSRPLHKDVDINDFWELVKLGQKKLDTYFTERDEE